MARVWLCNCGWRKVSGKKVWESDPSCHRDHPEKPHAYHVPAKYTGNQPKHEKKGKHRK